MEYQVLGGDSLSKIAAQYGLKWQDLWAANQGRLKSGNPNLIYPGEKVIIPGKTPANPSSLTPARDDVVTAPSASSNVPTAEDILKSSMDKIKEQVAFFKDFTSNNPFKFDEILAKQMAEEKYRPYYTQVLQDFVEPLQDKIGKSLSDETKLLGELTRQKEYGVSSKTAEFDKAIEKATEGFAGSGLLGSGLATRDIVQQDIKNKGELGDFVAGNQYKQDVATSQGAFERGQAEKSIAKGQRDVFGQGRDFDTALAKEVESKRGVAQKQYGTRVLEAITSRFGVPAKEIQPFLEFA